MNANKNKPLSFSTTIRNPERIVDFLKCIEPYEGVILTNNIIYEIVKNIIKLKLYKPNYILKNKILNNIYNSDDLFIDEQIEEIIKNSPQKHKEAGFEKGWPSRFDTWFKFMMELGFVKYSMGNPIVISETAHIMIDAAKNEFVDEKRIQNIFLNAMIKYQTRNPYRKINNDNVPLILLLQVLMILKQHDTNSSGVSKHELPFFICWLNNDASSLYRFIINFRKQYKFTEYTNELIYENCLKIMGYTSEADKKYIKMKKVVGEAVDEYIRKMRSTGIISLRGNGRFIDINKLEIKKIEYILDKYSTYMVYTDKDEYFNYMCQIDYVILRDDSINKKDNDNIKYNALKEYSQFYDKKEIFKELELVCKKYESRHPVFKFIAPPVRLEFLTSIALIQNWVQVDVYPNYIVDDEGLPTCTASGGKADIFCKDKNYDSLVEVTLLGGRQQVYLELIPIARHLQDAKINKENTVSIFIAPVIHPDVVRYAKFIKHDEKLEILYYNISDFIKMLQSNISLDYLISSL